MMIYKGTATEIIIKSLLYKTLPYKEVDKLLKKHSRYKNTTNSTIRSTLSRLKKKGLITKTASGWSASKSAREIMENRNAFDNLLPHKVKTKNSNQMIVMYDIPEKLRGKRNRLREGLIILGFKQKQKSVWMGPAPLPKEFIEFLIELNLLEYVNFFRVKEEDVV